MVPDGKSSELFLGSAGSITLILCHYFDFLFLWGLTMTGHKDVPEQVSVVLAGSRACWVMGTGCRRRCHTPWSGCSPALVAPAEAVSGSRSARTNSGRGHRKWRDASTESCFHWHWDWGVCVRACKCVSVFSTDRLTDCRSHWCMHDLSHSCLWKQHFSGPEESPWQEVVTSLDEQDKQNTKERCHISVILTGEVSNLIELWSRNKVKIKICCYIQLKQTSGLCGVSMFFPRSSFPPLIFLHLNPKSHYISMFG